MSINPFQFVPIQGQPAPSPSPLPRNDAVQSAPLPFGQRSAFPVQTRSKTAMPQFRPIEEEPEEDEKESFSEGDRRVIEVAKRVLVNRSTTPWENSEPPQKVSPMMKRARLSSVSFTPAPSLGANTPYPSGQFAPITQTPWGQSPDEDDVEMTL